MKLTFFKCHNFINTLTLAANFLDPKLIYTASEAMKLKVSWTKVTVDSEWTYFGDGNEVNRGVVEDSMNSHFTDNASLYVSTTRQQSFEANKSETIEQIEELLGKESFFIWDTKFRKVIEFNRIGVMRRGQVSS